MSTQLHTTIKDGEYLDMSELNEQTDSSQASPHFSSSLPDSFLTNTSEYLVPMGLAPNPPGRERDVNRRQITHDRALNTIGETMESTATYMGPYYSEPPEGASDQEEIEPYGMTPPQPQTSNSALSFSAPLPTPVQDAAPSENASVQMKTSNNNKMSFNIFYKLFVAAAILTAIVLCAFLLIKITSFVAAKHLRGIETLLSENKMMNRSILALEEKVNSNNELILTQTSEKLAAPKSCAYFNGVQFGSGWYWINPAESVFGYFQVYCDFSGGSATTMIGHDQEAETQVTSCEPQQCHRSDVTYHATDQQMRALIESSGTCRQFIKYRCKGSTLVGNESNPYAAWISARGTKKYNWDGSVGDYYCACGGRGTCLSSPYLTPPRCNCDNNNYNIWASDEGYLTSKPDLPVKALLFGEAGHSGEEGFHTLGKLECFGRV